jgi:hypothetical protein
VNVTNLPFEIRLGTCLPKECTQEMMTKASDSVTGALSTAVQIVGNLIDNTDIKKYNVGV